MPIDSLYDVTPKFLGELRAWLQSEFGGNSGYNLAQDEGVALPKRHIFDFVGAGVTASDDAANARTLVTVPGTNSSGGSLLSFGRAIGMGAYWPFDETSGALAHDASGNGWNLSALNPRTSSSGDGPSNSSHVSWADTVENGHNAPYLYGGNGYISGTIGSLSSSSDFALAIWVKVHAQFFLQPQIFTLGGGLQVFMDSSTGHLWFNLSGSSTFQVIDGGAMSVDAWHLVGVQCDGSGNWSLWLDGVQVGTYAGSMSAGTSIRIGQDPSDSYYLRGWISDGFWFTRHLTAAEWLTLHNLNNTVAGYVLQADGSGGTTWGQISPTNVASGYDLVKVAAKTSDTTLASQAVPQADPHLILPVSSSATEIWFVEYHLLVASANATMDFKSGFSVPTSCTMLWGTDAGLTPDLAAGFGGDATGSSPVALNTESGTQSFGTNAASGTQGIVVKGFVFGGGTAGNVTLKWSQNTSDAGNLTVKKGSFLRALKLAS